jgi:hypothetical protein
MIPKLVAKPPNRSIWKNISMTSLRAIQKVVKIASFVVMMHEIPRSDLISFVHMVRFGMETYIAWGECEMGD